MIVMLGSDTLRRVCAIVFSSNVTVLYVTGLAFARGMKIYGEKSQVNVFSYNHVDVNL